MRLNQVNISDGYRWVYKAIYCTLHSDHPLYVSHLVTDPNEVRCLERYNDDRNWPKIELSNSVPCPCSIQQLRLDGRFRLIYQYYDESNNVECYYNRFSQLHQSMCCYRWVISIIVAMQYFTFHDWNEAISDNKPYQ